LIFSQWYDLVVTLRLAVYTSFGKNKIKFGQKLLHPQRYAHPYTYQQFLYAFQMHRHGLTSTLEPVFAVYMQCYWWWAGPQPGVVNGAIVPPKFSKPCLGC